MIFDILNIEKLEKLYGLLDILSYDSDTKTLVVDSDINIIIKGNYKLDSYKHVRLTSNYVENDKKLNIPYSIFLNSEEIEFKKVQEEAKRILEEYDDYIDDIQGDCGCKD
jgi:hypothetical protein